jgi:hypothetical protein
LQRLNGCFPPSCANPGGVAEGPEWGKTRCRLRELTESSGVVSSNFWGWETGDALRSRTLGPIACAASRDRPLSRPCCGRFRGRRGAGSPVCVWLQGARSGIPTRRTDTRIAAASRPVFAPYFASSVPHGWSDGTSQMSSSEITPGPNQNDTPCANRRERSPAGDGGPQALSGVLDGEQGAVDFVRSHGGAS